MTRKDEFIEFINTVDYASYRTKIYGVNEKMRQEVYHSFYEPKDILLNETLLDFNDDLINSTGLEILSWNKETKPIWLK